MDFSRTWRALVAVVGASVMFAGCSPDSSDTKQGDPLPTASVTGKMVCGFVSEESIVTALGTRDFSLGGAKRDLRGSAKNEDGSKLNLAGCSAYTKDAPSKALDVSVGQIGVIPRWDSIVPTRLAQGGLDFVFPKEEGEGFATVDESNGYAAISHLIVGDWHFFVSISPTVKGRNAVQDAVALTRQAVTQLDLPKSGKLPRPTPTPAS
ncbi:MAG TPA: hypothetical protein VGD71_17535 [Kribbella sp.]|jgi:hypothetical protein